MTSMLTLLVIASFMAMTQAACPTPSLLTPCVCRDETPGTTVDCAAITSGDQLATVMQNDMGDDSDFTFFQSISSTASVTLGSLPTNTFGGKTFSHLWIGANDLTTVADGAFDGLETSVLDILIGESPSLSSFPFASLASLEYLFKLQITATALTSVTSFGNANLLGEVRLTNGLISSIASDTFSGLANLTVVDLAYNELDTVTAGAFKTTTQQSWSVYLGGNKISSVAQGAFDGTLPQVVALDSNQLTSITEAAFGGILTHMGTIDPDGTTSVGVYLSNNPIECDCAISWFATAPEKMRYVKGAVCATGDVTGTLVGDLPADHFDQC